MKRATQSLSNLVIAALLVAFSLAPVASAQTGTLFVEGNRVGVGVAVPQTKLHVQGSDGATQALVEETSGTEAERTLFEVINNGNTAFNFWDQSADGSLWQFKVAGPSVRFNKGGTGGEELVIRDRNDATGQATLVVNGSVKATNVTFTSSRELKAGFEAVDTEALLAKISALPISEWTFKAEQNGRRHIGPVAEDFNAAFELPGVAGEISLIDANGVALAGLQALAHKLDEKQQAIQELEQRNSDLEARLAALESLVAKLQQ